MCLGFHSHVWSMNLRFHGGKNCVEHASQEVFSRVAGVQRHVTLDTAAI